MVTVTAARAPEFGEGVIHPPDRRHDLPQVVHVAHLWFYAIYLMSSTRCGISAKQVERELGVTYKTAMRTCHLIRHELMADDGEALSGQVEMDEMFVGGKRRAGQVRTRQEAAAWANRKAEVLGLVERGGKVTATVVPSVRGETLMPHVDARVLPSSAVHTDEARRYQQLGNRGYQNHRIQAISSRLFSLVPPRSASFRLVPRAGRPISEPPDHTHVMRVVPSDWLAAARTTCGLCGTVQLATT